MMRIQVISGDHICIDIQVTIHFCSDSPLFEQAVRNVILLLSEIVTLDLMDSIKMNYSHLFWTYSAVLAVFCQL